MCSVFLSMCSGFLLHFVSGGNSEEDGPLDTTWSEKMQVCRLVIVGDLFISNDIIMTLSLITAVMIIAFQRWQYWLLRIYDSPLYTRLWQSVLTWQYHYIEVGKAKKCKISKLPLSRGWERGDCKAEYFGKGRDGGRLTSRILEGTCHTTPHPPPCRRYTM